MLNKGKKKREKKLIKTKAQLVNNILKLPAVISIFFPTPTFSLLHGVEPYQS